MKSPKWAPINEVLVGLDFGDARHHVGRLAARDHQIYFEYDAEFLEQSLEISPFRLPLKAGVQTFDREPFEGLPGVFNDSLPDGWGRLLFDRMLRQQGLSPTEVSPLDRLAHVGGQGMGALTYEPDHRSDEMEAELDLDQLARNSQEVMDGEAADVLAELFALNGSSAGARPKALIDVNSDRTWIGSGTRELKEGHERWLVKFANRQDGADSGAIEYVYALMAKAAGVEMSDVHLFPARAGPGYFATKRFDRDVSDNRLHSHTACGLLHADFRTPSLDYQDLLALTERLTRDVREVEKMYRLAVFNVLAHNRDDHSKNFSFLMNETGEWRLAPAYDITFSSGPRGEQSTMVVGEGNNPNMDHLTELGGSTKLPSAKLDEILSQTKDALAQWPKLATEFGVHQDNINLIGGRIVP